MRSDETRKNNNKLLLADFIQKLHLITASPEIQSRFTCHASGLWKWVMSTTCLEGKDCTNQLIFISLMWLSKDHSDASIAVSNLIIEVEKKLDQFWISVSVSLPLLCVNPNFKVLVMFASFVFNVWLIGFLLLCVAYIKRMI